LKKTHSNMVSPLVLHANVLTYLVGMNQGNSLQGNEYAKDVNKISHGILKWGWAMFKKHFHSTGQTLEIGRQQDSTSCGICVINSIEHHMLGTPLFTHDERDNFRVYYFTKATEFLLKSVRIVSLPKYTWYLLQAISLPSRRITPSLSSRP